MSTMEFNSNINFLKSALHSFAYSLTKDQIDAEDLCQEATLRALANKEKFRPGTNFKAWMFTITKNIFINNYRKKVKANTIMDSSDNMYYINSGSAVVENDVDRNILLKELNTMINALDDSIKIPFLMHFEGYKYQEIGEELGLPLGTVKSRIFFARRALKDSILSHYGDYQTVRKKLSA